ncbi:hypothetical protein E2493_07240 [Sphingomonas parva]|uniref:Uncharacterized protein n=2 Tax=Sphingomonas parva TaxID=2555898 RepID=A0A4Y8ZX14_9SPHN|nr:hypothetical protein E2493_07240 [Sphingomonas parva]
MAELFGVPIEAVVAAIYRAPARLLAGLEPGTARRLVASLAELGLTLDIVPGGGALDAGPALDLAAEIDDPALADAATAVIAEFLGLPQEEALELLMTPPGVIMGNVSAATVEAFARRLPPGALRLATADPATSRYALFAGGLDAGTRAAVEAVVGASGTADNGGLVALDLNHEDSNRLWRRLAGTPGARLVNQAFLRFEMVLTGIAAVDEPTAAALETLAGVPAEALPELAGLLPVVVEDGIPHERVEARLLDYAAHGLAVTARLATFAEQVLVVDSGPPEALALLGIDTAAALPLRLPPLPAPRARLARHRLEAAGADVSQFQAPDRAA